MLININRIKELKEKKTTIVDLSEFLGKNFDIILPFRIRGLDEQIKLLSNVKYGKTYKGVKKYMPYRDCPADFKKFYEESKGYKGSHEMPELEKTNVYVIVDPSKDEKEIKEMSLLERIMNIVIHIDMDFDEIEATDGEEVRKATLWEAFDVKEGDYLSLAKTFAGIITNETMVRTLELLLSGLKAGKTEGDLVQYVSTELYRYEVSKLSKEERETLNEELLKLKAEMDKKVAEQDGEK